MIDRRGLIDISKEILKEYKGKITIRQLYYRLVAKHIIPNTHPGYKRVMGAMKDARVKTREIPFNIFEDKTRDFTGDNPRWYLEPHSLFDKEKEIYESADQTFRDSVDKYSLPTWYRQPNYVEVWCEKDALENVFLPVCNKLDVTFGTARGCASISWLYEAAMRFRRLRKNYSIERIIVLLYTDNDPTGWQIYKSIKKYLYEKAPPETKKKDLYLYNVFELENVEVRRMALTKEQITNLDIPTDYAKPTDSRSKKWVEIHGVKASAELDAVEPRILQTMVQRDIEDLWSTEAANERAEIIQDGREQIHKLINEYDF